MANKKPLSLEAKLLAWGIPSIALGSGLGYGLYRRALGKNQAYIDSTETGRNIRANPSEYVAGVLPTTNAIWGGKDAHQMLIKHAKGKISDEELNAFLNANNEKIFNPDSPFMKQYETLGNKKLYLDSKSFSHAGTGFWGLKDEQKAKFLDAGNRMLQQGYQVHRARRQLQNQFTEEQLAQANEAMAQAQSRAPFFQMITGQESSEIPTLESFANIPQMNQQAEQARQVLGQPSSLFPGWSMPAQSHGGSVPRAAYGWDPREVQQEAGKKDDTPIYKNPWMWGTAATLLGGGGYALYRALRKEKNGPGSSSWTSDEGSDIPPMGFREWDNDETSGLGDIYSHPALESYMKLLPHTRNELGREYHNRIFQRADETAELVKLNRMYSQANYMDIPEEDRNRMLEISRNQREKIPAPRYELEHLKRMFLDHKAMRDLKSHPDLQDLLNSYPSFANKYNEYFDSYAPVDTPSESSSESHGGQVPRGAYGMSLPMAIGRSIKKDPLTWAVLAPTSYYLSRGGMVAYKALTDPNYDPNRKSQQYYTEQAEALRQDRERRMAELNSQNVLESSQQPVINDPVMVPPAQSHGGSVPRAAYGWDPREVQQEAGKKDDTPIYKNPWMWGTAATLLGGGGYALYRALRKDQPTIKRYPIDPNLISIDPNYGGVRDENGKPSGDSIHTGQIYEHPALSAYMHKGYGDYTLKSSLDHSNRLVDFTQKSHALDRAEKEYEIIDEMENREKWTGPEHIRYFPFIGGVTKAEYDVRANRYMDDINRLRGETRYAPRVLETANFKDWLDTHHASNRLNSIFSDEQAMDELKASPYLSDLLTGYPQFATHYNHYWNGPEAPSQSYGGNVPRYSNGGTQIPRGFSGINLGLSALNASANLVGAIANAGADTYGKQAAQAIAERKGYKGVFPQMAAGIAGNAAYDMGTTALGNYLLDKTPAYIRWPGKGLMTARSLYGLYRGFKNANELIGGEPADRSLISRIMGPIDSGINTIKEKIAPIMDRPLKAVGNAILDRVYPPQQMEDVSTTAHGGYVPNYATGGREDYIGRYPNTFKGTNLGEHSIPREKSTWEKIKQWIGEHKNPLIAGGVVTGTGLAGLGIYKLARYLQNTPENGGVIPSDEILETAYRNRGLDAYNMHQKTNSDEMFSWPPSVEEWKKSEDYQNFLRDFRSQSSESGDEMSPEAKAQVMQDISSQMNQQSYGGSVPRYENGGNVMSNAYWGKIPSYFYGNYAQQAQQQLQAQQMQAQQMQAQQGNYSGEQQQMMMGMKAAQQAKPGMVMMGGTPQMQQAMSRQYGQGVMRNLMEEGQHGPMDFRSRMLMESFGGGEQQMQQQQQAELATPTMSQNGVEDPTGQLFHQEDNEQQIQQQQQINLAIKSKIPYYQQMYGRLAHKAQNPSGAMKRIMPMNSKGQRIGGV